MAMNSTKRCYLIFIIIQILFLSFAALSELCRIYNSRRTVISSTYSKLDEENGFRNGAKYMTEACVRLVLDPPRSPPEEISGPLENISGTAEEVSGGEKMLELKTKEGLRFCRERLRLMGKGYRVSCRLSSVTFEALKKVPKFKDDEAALSEFIRSLAPRCKRPIIYNDPYPLAVDRL